MGSVTHYDVMTELGSSAQRRLARIEAEMEVLEANDVSQFPEGGYLVKWDGDINAWVRVLSQFNTQDSIHSLIVFNNQLYGDSLYHALKEQRNAIYWIADYLKDHDQTRRN